MSISLDEGWTLAVADGQWWESAPLPCRPDETVTFDLGAIKRDLRINRYVLRYRGQVMCRRRVEQVHELRADGSTYTYSLRVSTDSFKVSLGERVLDGTIPFPEHGP